MSYAAPQTGASLLLAFNFQHHHHRRTTLVIGSSRLAAARAFAALEADSKVIVLYGGLASSAHARARAKQAVCDELQWRGEQGQVELVHWDQLRNDDDDFAVAAGDEVEYRTFERYVSSIADLTFVSITDTAIGGDAPEGGESDDDEPASAPDTQSTGTCTKRPARPSPLRRRSLASAQRLYNICRKRNILVNTTDIPTLCDFTFTSSYRFDDISSFSSLSTQPEQQQPEQQKTSLQIGITTNGKGCRLAGRIRRDIVARLPRDLGTAVERVGRMRELAKQGAQKQRQEEEEQVTKVGASGDLAFEELNEEDNLVSTPNRPVPSRTPAGYPFSFVSPSISTSASEPSASANGVSSSPSAVETDIESARRRIKWVAQVSEYWPITKLTQLTEDEIHELLAGELAAPQTAASQQILNPSLYHPSLLPSLPSPLPGSALPSKGRILLAGSGPGHPSLLTLSTYTALTQLADVVLTDKLVPSEILALIPKDVKLKIAKKFPGNADNAQMELMRDAVEAAQQGKCVVRLKQGDPSIYGRSGEEILYCTARGFPPLLLPGLSSALTGPSFAGIPPTQRGVAESVVVCTGVARNGRDAALPPYIRSRTVVVLMGVARLGRLVDTLLGSAMHHTTSTTTETAAYPPHLPIAIIERATMPDQRVVYSTLGDVVQALESAGDQRPPGMIVIGWAVLALTAFAKRVSRAKPSTLTNGGKRDGGGGIEELDDLGGPGAGVLDDAERVGDDRGELDRLDQERVQKWLDGAGEGAGEGGGHVRWRVVEGLEEGWTEFAEVVAVAGTGTDVKPVERE